MEENEKDQLERRLAEQALFRQVVEKKDERLTELEAEVKYLRRTLNDFLAAPRGYVPQPKPAAPPLPRRWKAVVTEAA